MSSVMYDSNDGDSGEDKPENEIDTALQRLQEELAELRSHINRLAKRLEPVTRGDRIEFNGAIHAESIEAKDIVGSFTTPSPIRTQIMGSYNEVLGLRQEIVNLTKKLDI